MMNRKSIRLLIAWVLAVAAISALGSTAFASTGARSWLGAPTGSNAAKPVVRPLSGEPDVPQGSPQPPIRTAPLPLYGTGTSISVMRFHIAMRVLLTQLPKRFP